MARRNLHITYCNGYKKRWLHQCSLGIITWIGCKGIQIIDKQDFIMPRKYRKVHKIEWVIVINRRAWLDNSFIQMQKSQCLSVLRCVINTRVLCVKAIESIIIAYVFNASTLSSDWQTDKCFRRDCIRIEKKPKTMWKRKQSNVWNGGKGTWWEFNLIVCSVLYGPSLSL